MAPVLDLHPIVIPPIEVKVSNKTFTCVGDGLLKDGHGYESNLKQFLPLSEAKKTKAGNVAAKQPTPPSKPLAFWKAQCAFRNFVQSGSIEALQSRLGGTDPKMDKELAKEQTRVNKEFRIMNDEARKRSWSTLSTDEDKASVDPERFLRDRFFRQSTKKPSAKGDAIVLKTNDRLRIHQAAGPLDLFTESTEAPLSVDGSVPRIDRWIIVGTSKAAVSDKIREINRPLKQKASTTSKALKAPILMKEPKATTTVKKEPKSLTARKEPEVNNKLPSKRKREDSLSNSTTPLRREEPVRKKQTARKFVPSQKFVDSFPFASPETFPSTSTVSKVPKPRTKQTARKSVESRKWPEDYLERSPEVSSSSMMTTNSKPLQQAKKGPADSMSQVPWNVTGKWRVYCKALEDGWGSGYDDGEMMMTIHCSKEGSKYQLWALFDFEVFTGVFRFMEPEKSLSVSSKTTTSSGAHVKPDHDSKDEEFDGGEVFDSIGGEYDVLEERAPVPPSSFYLASLPSPSHPVIPFRWRGEETGEGEIQLGDDEYPCSMTFSGPGGVKCNGTFVSKIAATVQFSGLKMEDLKAPPIRSPQSEWKARGQKAYDRARTDRLGGWYDYSESGNDDEEGEERDPSSDEDAMDYVETGATMYTRF